MSKIEYDSLEDARMVNETFIQMKEPFQIYYISNYGRVFKYCGNKYTEMDRRECSEGLYIQITPSKEARNQNKKLKDRYTFKVHILTAIYFIEECKQYTYDDINGKHKVIITYKNDNYKDTRVENLVVTHPTENINIVNESPISKYEHMPISQFTTDGEYIRTVSGIYDVKYNLMPKGYNDKELIEALEGKRKTAFGSIWKIHKAEYCHGYRLKEHYLDMSQYDQKTTMIPVLCIDHITGRVLRRYNNIQEAKEDLCKYLLNNAAMRIFECCEGSRMLFDSTLWCYEYKYDYANQKINM